MNAQDWIKRLGLTPHPEGGWYKEVYRAGFQVTPAQGPTSGKPTSAVTSIHYLLENEDFSAFHRIAYPEIWYWHDGEPLTVHEISPDGTYTARTLGKGEGQVLSLVVEPGVWFAAELPGKKGYGLVSCAVAPGFDFAVFEIGKREELVARWPQYQEIKRLSKAVTNAM
jgi:predicted cupin superfamily sugar epimerase